MFRKSTAITLSSVLVLLIALLSWGTALAAAIPENGSTIKADIPAANLVQLSDGLVGTGDLLFRQDDNQSFSAGKNFWPNGILPYAFATNVTPAQQAAFLAACSDWMVGTPIKCKLRTSETDYLMVRTHTGTENACAAPDASCSHVGRQGGMQFLSVLASHWTSSYVVQHEIGHALGLIHEQNRSDRDDYLFVYENRIRAEFRGDIMPTLSNAAVLTPYDYNSIMHYGHCAGAVATCSEADRNTWAVEPKPCGIDSVGGTTISAFDYDGIRAAYLPQFIALLGKGEAPACGNLTYGKNIISTGCGGQCVGSNATIEYRKIEKHGEAACVSGFFGGFPTDYCSNRKKETIFRNVDSSHKCQSGLIEGTEYKLDETCACVVETVAGMCSQAAPKSIPEYTNPEAVGGWRAGRLQYFMTVLQDLDRQGMIEPEAMARAVELVYINGLDPRFESKLFHLRHTTFSAVTWRHSRAQSYKLTAAELNQLAKRAGLAT